MATTISGQVHLELWLVKVLGNVKLISKNNEGAFVPLALSGQVKNFIEVLKEMGWDIYPLLNITHLPESLESYPNNSYVAIRRVESLFHHVSSTMNQEQLRQFVGRSAHKNVVSILSTLDLKKEMTLSDALSMFCQQIDLISIDSMFRYERKKDKGVIACYKREHHSSWFALSEAYVISVMIEFVSQLLNESWLPAEIYAMTDDVSLYTSLYSAKQIQFFRGQSATRLVILDEDLDRLLDETHTQKAHAPQKAISRTMTDTLTHVLPLYILENRPTLAESAAIVGLTERTLKRRLQKENTTYFQVLDQCIMEMAKFELRRGSDSVSNIAFALGYQHANHFSRAFKRNTTLTPSEYRLKYQNNNSMSMDDYDQKK